jgi:cell division protein FtsB
LTTSGHIYWLSNRQTNQFAVAKALPGLSQPSGISAAIPAAIQRLALIPPRAILGMILLAAVGICSTVIHRSRAQFTASALQYQRMTSEIDVMRRSNSSLAVEIGRMASDPAVIESSARARLGMVRANDIVVPIGSLGSSSRSELVSLVR